MVLTGTKRTRFNKNRSFGEIINKFQDWSIEKHKDSWKKKEKLQNNKDSILFNQTSWNLYIYIYIYRERESDRECEREREKTKEIDR